jgi:hypothetical protein
MNGEFFLQEGNIFEGKTNAGVWQDKQPPGRLTARREEPATAASPAVGSREGSKAGSATATAPAVDRPTHHGSETRQTDQVTGRVPRHIKTAILQVAKQNGWTESKVIATACEAYLEQDLGEKFGVRLAAQVSAAIDKGLQKHSNREAYLTVHGYYAAEESRIITTKVLGYLFGSDTQIYQQIVKDARQDAKDNVKKPIEEKYSKS